MNCTARIYGEMSHRPPNITDYYIALGYLPEDHIAEDTHTLQSQDMGEKDGTNLEASSLLEALMVTEGSTYGVKREKYSTVTPRCVPGKLQ